MNYIIPVGNEFRFPHNGCIAIGKMGSGKTRELKKLLQKLAPELLVDNKIYIGSLHNDKLLYLDQPEMIKFVERILTYALIRDEYRDIKLKEQ